MDGRKLYTLLHALGYEYFEGFTVYAIDLLEYLKSHRKDAVDKVQRSEEVSLTLHEPYSKEERHRVRAYGTNGLRSVMFRSNKYEAKEYKLDVEQLLRDSRQFEMYDAYFSGQPLLEWLQKGGT